MWCSWMPVLNSMNECGHISLKASCFTSTRSLKPIQCPAHATGQLPDDVVVDEKMCFASGRNIQPIDKTLFAFLVALHTRALNNMDAHSLKQLASRFRHRVTGGQGCNKRDIITKHASGTLWVHTRSPQKFYQT